MSETHRSLAGKKILVTRAEDQGELTAAEILRRGGVPLRLPCLEMECLNENIRRSIPLLQIRHKQDAAEVLFTSRNGVQCVAAVFGDRFGQLLEPLRVTAIGKKTAATLEQSGISPGLMPETASQEGVIAAYKQTGIPKRLIFFRAEEGSSALSHALTAQGCEVITIHAYRMKCPESDATAIIKQIQQQQIDAVLLGSPKTAQHYLKRIGSIEIADIPAIAVISPQVGTAAENLGLSVQAIAKTASFDAMLDALADYFNKSGV